MRAARDWPDQATPLWPVQAKRALMQRDNVALLSEHEMVDRHRVPTVELSSARRTPDCDLLPTKLDGWESLDSRFTRNV